MNTTYFLNAIMGNVFNTQTTPALPRTYYIGLSSTAPNIGGTGVTEPSTTGTGYSRIEITSLTAPSNGAITNSSDIVFNESTGDLGVMTHYVVYDAPTGGNLLFYGLLEEERHLEANTIILIRSGELDTTLSN